jgi:hypothetical protein
MPAARSRGGCGETWNAQEEPEYLAARGITCSMSRRGDCYDNTAIESFFATVKKEEAERFPSYSDAKMALFDYIEVFYNQRRPTLDARPDQSGGLRAPGGGVGHGRCHPCGRQDRTHTDLENRTNRGFPQRPHPSSCVYEEERRPSRSTLANLSTDSDHVQLT